MEPSRVVGNYELFGEIAAGGIATLHYGRYRGPAGFSRIVAIKRLHDEYAKDELFVSMFVDEARLVSRVNHPNVVKILDVLNTGEELLLVMDYVRGETLAGLLEACRRLDRGGVPPAVAASVMHEVLLGLHAAHEARSESGALLGLVHRDVSPQNIMVGADGHARVVDFGVALARQRVQTTRPGEFKGKAGYFAPEQVLNQQVDRRADVFVAAAVLWEALTLQQLFEGRTLTEVAQRIVDTVVSPPSALSTGLSPALDAVVMRGLQQDRRERYQTAEDMARALLEAAPPAAPSEVSAWLVALAAAQLEERDRVVKQIESRRTQWDATSPASTARAANLRRRTAGKVALLVLALVASAALALALYHRGRATTGPAATPAAFAPAVAQTVDSGAQTGRPDAAGLQRDAGRDALSARQPDAADRELEPQRPAARRLKRKASPQRWRKPGHRPQPAKRGGGCDPPYVLNPDGVRIPKPECL